MGCGSGLGEKDEEELGSWSLEYGSFGYLVGYLEREKIDVFLTIKLCRFKIIRSIF